MNIKRSALSLLFTLTLTVSLSAQGSRAARQAGTDVRKPNSIADVSDYIVSAKAGVINIAEGDVNVIRSHPFAVPEMLISGDELKLRDVVKTGSNGHAEVLLNPGCYLRLGGASQFVFLFDEAATNSVKLLSGSAVIEVSAMDDSIFVETPSARFEIVSVGLYRFNVGVDGKPEIIVRKGRALVSGKTIKKDSQASAVGGAALIAKANKQDVDELDDWSKSRAKALVAANSNLSNKSMRRSAGMTLLSNAWIYDPFGRFYTFLPMTGGFSSPYGWGYSRCNPYWYRLGWGEYYGGGWSGGSSRSGGSTSSSGSSGSGSSGVNTGGHHRHFEPPQRLPQSSSGPSMRSSPERTMNSSPASSGAPGHVHRHP